MESNMQDGKLVIRLEGKIDTNNAADVEEQINAIIAQAGVKDVVLDTSDLEYISSAGLRVLLRQRQTAGELTVRNVSPEVYEIFDVTGFSDILNIE